MKRFAVPFAALAIAACSDMSTAPLAEEATAVSTSASFSGSVGGAASLDFSADLNRIKGLVPAFNDPSVGERFVAHIEALSTSLGAGDKIEAARVLELAQQELSLSGLKGGDTGYVQMVFRSVGQAVTQ